MYIKKYNLFVIRPNILLVLCPKCIISVIRSVFSYATSRIRGRIIVESEESYSYASVANVLNVLAYGRHTVIQLWLYACRKNLSDFVQ